MLRISNASSSDILKRCVSEGDLVEYTIDIAGLKRDLTLFPVSEDTMIGALILFGDVELTTYCAAELLKRAPEFDIILTAEAKSIPLAYEMARESGMNDYVVARKSQNFNLSPQKVSRSSILENLTSKSSQTGEC